MGSNSAAEDGEERGEWEERRKYIAWKVATPVTLVVTVSFAVFSIRWGWVSYPELYGVVIAVMMCIIVSHQIVNPDVEV